MVHFVEGAKNRIAEAERAGVNSVPALEIDGSPLQTNHGSIMEEVKKAKA